MDRALLQTLTLELGITPERMRAIQAAPSFEEAKQRLVTLKADVKKAFKGLALKYHPDKNPGDPTAEAKFKGILAISKEIESLNVAQPRTRPVVHQWVQVHPAAATVQTGVYTNYGSAVDSVNAGPTPRVPYEAWRVAYIRVV